jgi:hypothetical protein
MTEHPTDSHTMARYEATGGYDRRQAAGHDPRRAGRAGQGIRPARPGRRRLLGRHEVELHGPGPARLPRHQRRRVGAGHLQGQPAARTGPPSDDRGHHHRRHRQRGAPRLRLHPGRVPQAGPPGPAGGRRRLRRRVSRQGHLRNRTTTSNSPSTSAAAPTSVARRPPSSTRSKASAASPASSRRTSRRPRAST